MERLFIKTRYQSFQINYNMHFKYERQPFGWVLAHKLSHTTKTAHHLDALFLKYGDPAGYCVLAGKRNKQAKDKQTNKVRLFGQKRSNRGPQKILCTFGDKEYASKRANIIASDNVTSKAKCATRGQQGSSTAKRKCLHFEASVQCDRGTGAHGVRKGGETALFEPMLFPDT